MLASRSLRFLALRCKPAPLYTWSIKTNGAPMAVNTTTTWYIRQPAMTAAYSKDSKNETSSAKNPSVSSPEPQDRAPPYSSTESSEKCSSISPKVSSTSCPSSSTVTDKCFQITPDSAIQPPNIKLPSRDQVEKFFFTSLVYVWDFCYYVFCLTLRLIDTYILKNPTLQENWKKLIKRMDEQRQAIKSKK